MCYCQRVGFPLLPHPRLRKNVFRKDDYIMNYPDLTEPLFPHSHPPPTHTHTPTPHRNMVCPKFLYGKWCFAEGSVSETEQIKDILRNKFYCKMYQFLKGGNKCDLFRRTI